MPLYHCEVCQQPFYLRFGRGKRCELHRTKHDQKYGWKHRQERAKWAQLVADGRAYCMEKVCRQPVRWIHPASFWDLAHAEDGLAYLGPAHRGCNRREAGERGNEIRYGTPRKLPPEPEPSRDWGAARPAPKNTSRDWGQPKDSVPRTSGNGKPPDSGDISEPEPFTVDGSSSGDGVRAVHMGGFRFFSRIR